MDTVDNLKRRLRGLEQQVRELERRLSGIPVRMPAGGGGGLAIRSYDTFPPIPSGPTIIYCKDQIYYADSESTVWYPLVKFTSETGEVGT